MATTSQTRAGLWTTPARAGGVGSLCGPTLRSRRGRAARSTVVQPSAQGVTDWHLRHRAIARSSRDTYLPLQDASDRVERTRAVLLGAPPGAVVSHGPLRRVRPADTPRAEDRRVHLTLPPPSAPVTEPTAGSTSPPPVRHRCSVARARGRHQPDMAAISPPWPAGALLAITDQMLARITRSGLAACSRLPGRSVRCAAAREALRAADPLAGSPMESVAPLAAAWRPDSPAPVLQHVSDDGDGRSSDRSTWRGPIAGSSSSSTETCTGNGRSSSRISGGRTGWSWPAGPCCGSPPPMYWGALDTSSPRSGPRSGL